MKNLIQPGERLDVAAPYALSPGEPFAVGDLFGVCSGVASAAGQLVVMFREGVFELPKASADVIAVGDKLYWDAANKVLTGKAIGQRCATAVSVAGAGATTVVADIEGTLEGTTASPNEVEIALNLDFADVSAASSQFVASPIAGTIKRMDVVMQGAIDVNTSFAAKLGGVAVTDGAVSVVAAASAAGTKASAVPTAANAVAAGGAIEVACGGEGSAAVKATVTLHIVG
ncbi:MAG: DUF2190 family protein [Bacteroidota bacterium]